MRLLCSVSLRGGIKTRTLIFLILCATKGFGQHTSQLKDGVYFSFQDVRNNAPNLTVKDLFKSYYDTTFTIKQWATAPELYYKDKNGERQHLSYDSLWGYSEAGVPFIALTHRFHRISTVGSISLFREFYPVVREGMTPVVTDVKGTSTDRILDFETGEIKEYSLENFSTLLMRDEELYKEFSKIEKPKAKRKKAYVYLEKYNEKHPMFKN